MKNVLVTGAAGFIGRNLVTALRRREDVSLATITSADGWPALAVALEQADVVYHLAGVNRPQSEDEFATGNAELTRRIVDHLEELGRTAKIVIPSSIQAELDNPYGRSKLIIEDILIDVHQAEPDWHIALLRYFNPVGAHSSGRIGEDPRGVPNNLMPYVARVAVGTYPSLSVFGNDYPTVDGTGVRDYIHVVDLAKGHVAALNAFQNPQAPHLLTVNLGTGQGYSVLEMIQAFERASQKNIPYKIVARRAGDVAACFADPNLAKQLLGWQAEKNLLDMCEDVWRWQQQNPQGYS